MAKEKIEDKLYYKILDLMITLRDVHEEFKTYSPTDIKKLIASKLKSKKIPVPIKHLYNVELLIAEIREIFNTEKDILEINIPVP